MAAEKTSKLQGYPYFISHRGEIRCIVCENEISNQRLFSKAQKATSTNMENLKIFALVDVYYMCVRCFSFDIHVIGC